MMSSHTLPHSAAKPISKLTLILEKMSLSVIKERTVDANAIMSAIHATIKDQPLHHGQLFTVPFQQVNLDVRVDTMTVSHQDINDETVTTGYLTNLTTIYFKNQLSHYFTLINESPVESINHGLIQGIPFDFTTLGVGGYKHEMAEIIRTAFYTRLLKPEMLKQYGITQHTKGVLLHGPTGTGKTRIAIAISKLFAKNNVRVIEGPQLKSAYYGQSQQNLANVFKEAREKPEEFFVYIFEEIDSITAKRGSDNSVTTSNNNDLVDRFLPILQGPNSPDNILIIGTTNRIDMIDPAILRPGRFDCVVEIGLPKLEDRLEILKIHTKDMQKTLANDVNLTEVAQLTENFNCAELVSVIDKARKSALSKNFIVQNNTLILRPDITCIEKAEKVTQTHFLQAIQDCRPSSNLDTQCSHPFFSRRN